MFEEERKKRKIDPSFRLSFLSITKLKHDSDTFN